MDTLIFKPKNVCSQEMRITHENGIIVKLEVSGGCSGNLSGISRLIEGLPIATVIAKLDGVRCGSRSTSCPDQLARALKSIQK
jgi:uncharacterized protein (TIGR03905 family)